MHPQKQNRSLKDWKVEGIFLQEKNYLCLAII